MILGLNKKFLNFISLFFRNVTPSLFLLYEAFRLFYKESARERFTYLKLQLVCVFFKF